MALTDKLGEIEKEVRITYSWAGETREWVIQPGDLFYGTTQWHSRAQWILRAWVPEIKEIRDFAMGQITEWIDAHVEPGALL